MKKKFPSKNQSSELISFDSSFSKLRFGSRPFYQTSTRYQKAKASKLKRKIALANEMTNFKKHYDAQSLQNNEYTTWLDCAFLGQGTHPTNLIYNTAIYSTLADEFDPILRASTRAYSESDEFLADRINRAIIPIVLKEKLLDILVEMPTLYQSHEEVLTKGLTADNIRRVEIELNQTVDYRKQFIYWLHQSLSVLPETKKLINKHFPEAKTYSNEQSLPFILFTDYQEDEKIKRRFSQMVSKYRETDVFFETALKDNNYQEIAQHLATRRENIEQRFADFVKEFKLINEPVTQEFLSTLFQDDSLIFDESDGAKIDKILTQLKIDPQTFPTDAFLKSPAYIQFDKDKTNYHFGTGLIVETSLPTFNYQDINNMIEVFNSVDNVQWNEKTLKNEQVRHNYIGNYVNSLFMYLVHWGINRFLYQTYQDTDEAEGQLIRKLLFNRGLYDDESLIAYHRACFNSAYPLSLLGQRCGEEHGMVYDVSLLKKCNPLEQFNQYLKTPLEIEQIIAPIYKKVKNEMTLQELFELNQTLVTAVNQIVELLKNLKKTDIKIPKKMIKDFAFALTIDGYDEKQLRKTQSGRALLTLGKRLLKKHHLKLGYTVIPFIEYIEYELSFTNNTKTLDEVVREIVPSKYQEKVFKFLDEMKRKAKNA